MASSKTSSYRLRWNRVGEECHRFPGNGSAFVKATVIDIILHSAYNIAFRNNKLSENQNWKSMNVLSKLRLLSTCSFLILWYFCKRQKIFRWLRARTAHFKKRKIASCNFLCEVCSSSTESSICSLLYFENITKTLVTRFYFEKKLYKNFVFFFFNSFNLHFNIFATTFFIRILGSCKKATIIRLRFYKN